MKEIEKFIEVLETLKEKKIDDEDDLHGWKANAINLVTRIYGSESKQEEQINNVRYSSSDELYFVGPGGAQNIPSSNNISSCNKQCIHLINGIITDLKFFGLPEFKKPKDNSNEINIAINQTQSVKQKISINIILDAIKDELTGTQLKELQNIIDKDGKPDDKKKRYYKKTKEFWN